MPPDSSSTQPKQYAASDIYRPKPEVAAIAAEWMPAATKKRPGQPRAFETDMLHMQLALLDLHQAGMDAATSHRAAQTAAYLERELMCPGQGGYYRPTLLTETP